MWHPTNNKGRQPADITAGSTKKVWLQCPGCRHGCGRHHEWEARPERLTQYGGHIVCPFCESKGRGGRFCECQSVAADPGCPGSGTQTTPPPLRWPSAVAESTCGSAHKAIQHTRLPASAGVPGIPATLYVVMPK